MKIYQIVPEPLSLMMCYIILTDNGKVIVIDGGIDGHGKHNPVYLPSAIRAVLGLGQEDYFRVDAWFLSHIHCDHFYELAKMLCEYNADSNYRIENFYFSFPPQQNGWESRGGEGDYNIEEFEQLKKGFDNYADITGSSSFTYDRLNGAVINPENIGKGLTIEVDGCCFDILQTWDSSDLIVNSTSTVIRLRYKEHSVLFLGDAYIDTGDRLLKTYPAESLRSEYVQLAHHGQHGVSEQFYHAIDTDNSVRLWPSPNWVWGVYRHGAIVCDETRSWFGLPEKPDDYFAAGCDKTGNDIVSGCYSAYPENPTLVSSWTEDVLSAQLAAEL